MPESRQQRPAFAKSSEDQKELQSEPMQEHHPLSVGMLIFFPNIMCPLRYPLEPNITHSFTRQIPEKRHISVLSKTSSHMSASAEHPLVRQFPEKQII